jgi:hypothetical protein
MVVMAPGEPYSLKKKKRKDEKRGGSVANEFT